ncbi:MAG: 2-(1,2-epoxy,2-dihydrophenyl)acetyl-CoA isomerase, partial [Solirubrobacteraceae bacterium]|nr:2-(1,2-epoxy,2-dihydrophenyl)acetyl-CoA isomerase [Solirubrobacteraceae bacterium]
MSDLVLTEDRGRVRHVVLNRPEKRNAFNADLIAALDAALEAAAEDPSVHVVVLRGAGPMFSSGVDLAELADMSRGVEVLRPFRKRWLDVANRLEEMPKATVCQIHGGCIGGALETALACDLRTMAAEAIAGLPETRIGLIP